MLICPKCGANSDDVQFIGPFCINCYKFKVKLPKSFVIKQCTKCKKVWIDREWKPFSQKEIEKSIASKFKGKFEKVDYYLDSGTAVIYFKVGQKIYMVEKKFNPKYENVLCRECSRRSGGYYEAIIQFRGNKENIKKYEKKLIHKLIKKTFLSKIEERKEGVDLFLGNSRAVFEILGKLKIKYKKSRKLFTQKKGKKMYRLTFAIRV